MGRSLKVVLLKQTNMKLLLVLAAAGLSCAAPEADPAFAYSIGHHPLVYTHPVTYTLPTVAYHPYAYGYPYSGLLPMLPKLLKSLLLRRQERTAQLTQLSLELTP